MGTQREAIRVAAGSGESALRDRIRAGTVRAAKSLLGLTPMAVPPYVFEVDDGALRYGAFQRSPDGWSLTASAEIELPPGIFQSGPLGGGVRDRERLEEELGALLERTETTVSEASLVVPDRWLRLLFTDLGEGFGASLGDEVLRWKLKKLVPYRVEDLRVAGAKARALSGEGAPDRLLVAFALDRLLDDLEQAFLSRGVRLGQIASRTLYLMDLLAELDGEGALVAHVEPDGHSIFFLSEGAPALVRYRALSLDPGDTDLLESVARDLRILRGFLAENLPAVSVSRGLVCAPADVSGVWTRLLGECFAVETGALGPSDLPLVGAAESAVSWHRLAPMLGAATGEAA